MYIHIICAVWVCVCVCAVWMSEWVSVCVCVNSEISQVPIQYMYLHTVYTCIYMYVHVCMYLKEGASELRQNSLSLFQVQQVGLVLHPAVPVPYHSMTEWLHGGTGVTDFTAGDLLVQITERDKCAERGKFLQNGWKFTHYCFARFKIRNFGWFKHRHLGVYVIWHILMWKFPKMPKNVNHSTNFHIWWILYMYSTDQMQGIRQRCLPSRVNVFVSLYKPI